MSILDFDNKTLTMFRGGVRSFALRDNQMEKMIMRKKAQIREGEAKVLVVEIHFDTQVNPLLGKWLDVPFSQCVEEGNITLMHNGIKAVVPCDDIMFHDSDTFFI